MEMKMLDVCENGCVFS